MKINGLTLLVLLSAMLYSCNQKQEEQETIKVKKYSAIVEKNGLTILNSYYFENLIDGRVLTVNKRVNLAEQTQAAFRIEPILPKEDSAKWAIRFIAEKYTIYKNTLVAESTEPDKEASYTMYNLLNGNKLISYTYDRFNVLFSDENKKRTIGFYSKNAANRKESKLNFEPLVIGYISYANENEFKKQLKISLSHESWIDGLDISSPVIELKPLNDNALSLQSGKTLYFSDTENMIDFDIVITFYAKDDYKEQKVVIPVRNDVLQIDKNTEAETIFKVELV